MIAYLQLVEGPADRRGPLIGVNPAHVVTVVPVWEKRGESDPAVSRLILTTGAFLKVAGSVTEIVGVLNEGAGT